MKASAIALLPLLSLIGCEKSELHFQAPGVTINSSGTKFQASGDVSKLQEGLTASGPITTVSRQVSDFHSIDANSVVTVEFQKGDKVTVEVSAKKDILDKVTTNVSNGILHLGLGEGLMIDPGTVTIKVTGPNLDAITCSGSSSVMCTGTFEGPMHLDVSGASSLDLAGSSPKLELSLSGSGKLAANSLQSTEITGSVSGGSNGKLGGKLGNIDLNVSGSGNVHLSGLENGSTKLSVEGGSTVEADGTTDQLTVTASGAPSINLPSLVSQNCEVTAEGASQVHVNAVKSLKANAAGASSVGYTGTPASLSPQTEGASTVKSDG